MESKFNSLLLVLFVPPENDRHQTVRQQRQVDHSHEQQVYAEMVHATHPRRTGAVEEDGEGAARVSVSHTQSADREGAAAVSRSMQ